MVNERRQTEYDMLRCLALCAVIMVHVLGGGRNSLLSVHTREWLILNCFYAVSTWEVPIFIMISGRFFLDEERAVTIQKLFGKYIKRLVIAFVVWTLVYQLYALIRSVLLGQVYLNVFGFIYECIVGEYHLWYIYMQIGLYLLTPFLRKIAEDRKLTQYYLILFFLFSTLESYGRYLPGIGGAISTILDKSEIHFVLGYAGYYLMGYFLYKYPLSPKSEKMLYAVGGMMLVFSCVSTTLYAKAQGMYTDWFTGFLMPSTIIEAAAIYTFFVKRVSRMPFSTKTAEIFAKFTELSFGAYLVHVLVQKLVLSAGLTPNVHPIIMVPALTFLIFAVSLLLTFLIRKIPVIG